MKIEVVNHVKHQMISKKELKEIFVFFTKSLLQKKILSSQSANKKLVIVFVSSSEIKKLNKKFLKKDSSTDILSFSALEDEGLGELVLCIEKIKQQAKEHQLSFKEETAYLLLHGLLHLLGYHHEKGGASAKKMYQIQDKVFSNWQNARL